MQHPCIGDAVERDTTGQAERVGAGAFPGVARETHHHLLGDLLDGEREVRVPLRTAGLGPAPLHPEQPLPAPYVDDGAAAVEGEVPHVEDERAVLAHVDEPFQDQFAQGVGLRGTGVAVGRQSHQLVLAAVHLEPAEMGHRRVQQAEGVREDLLGQGGDPRTLAEEDAGGRPLAHPVDGQDGGTLERRGVVRARRVREVVPRPQDGQVRGQPCGAQPRTDQPLRAVGARDAAAHGEPERLGPARRGTEQTPADASALEPGRLVVGDRVHCAGCLVEQIGEGLLGEGGVVLVAREALLLRGGDEFAVDDESRGAVVVEGRDAHDGGHGRTRPFGLLRRWHERSAGEVPARPARKSAGPYARSSRRRAESGTAPKARRASGSRAPPSRTRRASGVITT